MKKWVQQAAAKDTSLSDADTTSRTAAARHVNVEMTLDYFAVCKELNTKMRSRWK